MSQLTEKEISQSGSLRVWHIQNMLSETQYHPVESVDEAKVLLRKLIASDLANKSIQDNAFGLEEFEDFGEGLEWCEWYGSDEWDNALDIMEVLDKEDEANN